MQGRGIFEMRQDTVLAEIKYGYLGLVLGLLCFMGAVLLLFWNERQVIKNLKTLRQVRQAVISVPSDRIDPQHDGRVVYLHGHASTDETLTDPVFQVSANALRLRRVSEMYQWQETPPSGTGPGRGAGKTGPPTFRYRKIWSDQVIASDRFNQRKGHQNPRTFRYPTMTFEAQKATLGAFRLHPDVVRHIEGFKDISTVDAGAARRNYGRPIHVLKKGYFIGRDPKKPAIGDLRIRFQVVRPCTISVIASQGGNMLAPFRTEGGEPLAMVQVGVVRPKKVLNPVSGRSGFLNWTLRMAGFLLMGFMALIFVQPLFSALGVFFFMEEAGQKEALFAVLSLAMVFTLVPVAAAWIFYGTTLGLSLLTIAAVILLALKILFRAETGVGMLPDLLEGPEGEEPVPARPARAIPRPLKARKPPGPETPDEARKQDLRRKRRAWMEKGLELYQAGDFTKAIQVFTKVISEHPGYATAYYNRGLVYRKTDRAKHALKDLKMAAKLGHQKARRLFLTKKRREAGSGLKAK
jgi:hypothetical protein